MGSGISYGQEIAVSDPSLELRGNIVHITYDILNSTSSDRFVVELRITDARGDRVPARTLSGDIGDDVPGGRAKYIDWDPKADNIEMEGSIFVDIKVKKVLPITPIVAPVKEEEKDDPVKVVQEEGLEKPGEDDIRPKAREASSLNQFSRTGLMLQSVVFPGLGLTRYRGGPHWIKGVAAYGCIAGSVVLNKSAINSYSGIIDLTELEEKNTLYEKAVQQDNISEALIYTAIGIWVVDLVWTFLGTSDIKRTANSSGGVRINSTIDPVSSAPMLAFTYKF